MATKTQIAAVRRYEEKKYDRINVRLPKGTREEIQARGRSLNSFIVDAVMDKLDTREEPTQEKIEREDDGK